jgi:hypothetical protein
VHPISARESRALRKLLREAPTSPYVFISERRAPLSVAGYQRMVARAGWFHNRLAASKKKPKVIIVAVMRKMITTLNAMVRDNAAWQPRAA